MSDEWDREMDREQELFELKPEAIFDVKVKGKVDPIWRLQRQLERTNIIASSGDEETFEWSVEVLLSELPTKVKQAVEQRRDEYHGVEEKLVYKFFAGVPINNPKLGSPRKVVEERINYFRLFEIIKEELENASLSWEYREEHPALRRMVRPVPSELKAEAREALKKTLEKYRRRTGINVEYSDLIVQLQEEKEPNPKLEGETEE